MRKNNFTLLILILLLWSEAAYSQDKIVSFENGDVATLVRNKDLWGAVDRNGVVIIPKQYQKIETEGNYFICKIRQDDKDYYEAYSSDGTCIVNADNKVKSLSCIKIRGHWFFTGYVNLDSSYIWDEQGIVLYKYKVLKDQQGFCSLINEVTDTIVVETGRYTKFDISRGIIKANVGRKMGVLSMDGTEIIPAMLYKNFEFAYLNNEIHGFRVGISSFNAGAIGYVDLDGRCIFPAVDFTNIRPLVNGQYEVKIGEKAGIADCDGNLLFMTQYQSLYPCTLESGNQGYKAILAGGKGYLDKEGNILVEPKVTTEEYREKKKGFSYIKVRAENGRYGIKSTSKKTVIPSIYDSILFDEKADCFKVYSGRFQGLIGKDGKVIIPCDRYEYLSTLNYPIIEVEYLGKVGLCNSSGEVIVQPYFDGLTIFGDVIYTHIGLFEGALDLDGKVLVPPDFTHLFKMKRENDRYWFLIKMFEKIGYFDTKYGLVVPPKYSSASLISKPITYYRVLDGESAGCFSEDGKMLIPPGVFDNVKVKEINDFGHKYLTEAYNNDSPKERYYYDLQGNIVKALNYDEEFNTLFQEAHVQYENKDYKKALELYNKAKNYKKTPTLYFNIGATYYNLEDYKNALYYFENCEKYTSSANLKDRSTTLIADCKERLKPQVVVKEKKKSSFWVDLATGFFEVASAVLVANTAMTRYNTYVPSTYPASYNYMPTYYQLDIPVTPPSIDWGEYFKKEKEDFISKFRANYYTSHGKMPTEEEEELAFTQYLQARNSSISNNNSTQWSNSSSSSSTSSSSTTSSKPVRRCGLCGGTGTTVESVATFGIVEKEYCSTCGKTVYNGHYHKTCSLCHGTGFE